MYNFRQTNKPKKPLVIIALNNLSELFIVSKVSVEFCSIKSKSLLAIFHFFIVTYNNSTCAKN